MSRLFGVILIYLTRPLCWVLLAVIAAILSFGWSLRSEEYATYGHGAFSRGASSFFNYQKRVGSLESLNVALKKQNEQPVAVRYGSLALHLQYKSLKTNDAGVRVQELVSDEEAIKRLERLEFPPLTRWLTTGGWEVRQSTIEHIGSVSSLEHVDLLVSDSDSVPLDLSPFAKLVNLESLNLGKIIKMDSLAPLQALPKLETLTIGNQQCVTAKNLREVATIKSLRQLFLPDVTKNPVAMAALDELNLSSLQQVYIAIPPAESAKLEAISSILPGLRVRPSQYLPMRAWGCAGLLWALSMISLLGIHFFAMFSVSAAVLTPGYRVTQRRVASGVMLGLILLGAGVMWSCKVNLGLALALSALGIFASVSTDTGMQTISKPVAGAKRWFGLLVIIAIVSVIGWAMLHPLEADYLLARPPWWGVVLLSLMAIFLAMKLNVRLNSLCRDRVAAGNEPILSFFDMQELKLKRKSERKSERSGDQVEPFERITNGMVRLGLISLLSILALRYAPAYWFTPMIDGVLQRHLPMFALGVVMLIPFKWWSRAPFLATMMTRPPSREAQIKQIFVGVAADFARAGPLLLAAVFSIGSQVVDKFGSPVEAGVVTCLLAAGFVGMAYALTLVAITVRSTRWIIATCLIAIVTSSLFSGLVVYIGTEGSSWVLESGMFIAYGALSMVILAMSVGATMLIWRRYHKIEWGMFLS